MFYISDLVFYNSDSRGLFIRDSSAFQLSTSGKVVENSTEPTELDRVGPGREQEGASGLAGLVGLAGLSSMVGTFFVGQDFRRHPSKSIAPLPTPAPIAQHAGDVKVGGVHLLEFHWNTVVGGGGLVLLIVLVVALTYCCVRGYLQACCLNTCRLCCPP